MEHHVPHIDPTKTPNRQVELTKQARQAAPADSENLDIGNSEHRRFFQCRSVERREIILSRVEAMLGESDSRVLPRVYGELSRTSRAAGFPLAESGKIIGTFCQTERGTVRSFVG